MKEKHWFEVMNDRIGAGLERFFRGFFTVLIEWPDKIINKILYAMYWLTGGVLLEKGLAKLLRKKKDLNETGELIYRLQVICLLASVLLILMMVMKWTN